MKKGSENFGGELFDAMCRRRYMYEDSINKAEFKEFWEQICEPKFEYRLRTFFDM
jgi:respiratory burst oxidase